MSAQTSLRTEAVALMLAVWVACGLSALASTNHHVILITIDGLAAAYLSDPQAPIPTLRKLMTAGAVVLLLFLSWEDHLIAQGKEPLINLPRLRNPVLRGGLIADAVAIISSVDPVLGDVDR